MEDLKATGLCPICRHEIPGLPGVPPEAAQCIRCATWYHQDCWEYGGRTCGIFGCEPATRSRPCPEAPHVPGPFWRELTRFGFRLSGGMALFLLGSLLGLLGWGLGGPLAVPVILLLGWCSDTGDRSPSTLSFRRGVLWGPPALFLVPLPMLFLGAIPFGLALALAGVVLRAASRWPRLAGVLAVALAALLVWSHQPDGQPVPFAVVANPPRWAVRNSDIGHTPYVLCGPGIMQAWRIGQHLDGTARRPWADNESCLLCLRWFATGGPLPRPVPDRILAEMMAQPDAPVGCQRAAPLRPVRRLLVVPWHEMRDVQVTRADGRIRVRYGASLLAELAELLLYSPFSGAMRHRQYGFAIALPDDPEVVEVRARSLVAGLIGPRLDALLPRPTEKPVRARSELANTDLLVHWLGGGR